MKRYEIDHRTANFLGISKDKYITETMYFAVSFNCLAENIIRRLHEDSNRYKYSCKRIIIIDA